MPTEAGRTAARQAAWAAMTGRNWTQGEPQPTPLMRLPISKSPAGEDPGGELP